MAPEAPVITDFAITTINVPDRLDAQEVRARAEAEEESRRPDRIDGHAIGRWLGWILAICVVAGIVWAAYVALAPVRAEISSAGVAKRLSQALSRPVMVATSEIRLAPYPRLVVSGVDAGDGVKLAQVSLRFSWSSLAKAVRGGGWVWGEASVAPVDFSPDSGLLFFKLLPALSRVVPESIPTVKFESVGFPGSPLLPGRYEAVARRAADGTFSLFTLSEVDIPGRMDLHVEAAQDGSARFKMRATNWRPPFGPTVEWNESTAEGSFSSGRVQIDRYSANGFFGVLTGTLQAARGASWTVSGDIQGSNFDLGAIRQHVVKRTKPGAGEKNGAMLQGILETRGSLVGRGASLADALAQLAAAGRAQVRFAALNGINLGLAATQGVSGEGLGGVTRFTDLEAAFSIANGTLSIRDISGRAGALAVAGALGIERDLSLRGILRPEVSSARGQLSADVQVSGSVLQPNFGN